jgi:hypothetical protein
VELIDNTYPVACDRARRSAVSSAIWNDMMEILAVQKRNGSDA